MNIYLIRHGKDDGKYRGGWSSHPLIEEGIEQSKKLAEYLERKQSEYNIQKIISSDLKRAIQTADIINEKLSLPIEYADKLREMDNGELAGMLNEEAQIKYPGLYYNTLAIDEKYPGGESPIDFYNRISQNFNEIINENTGVENLIKPMIYNVNFGHSNPIMTIPIGVCAEIDSCSPRITLLESPFKV